MRKQLEEWSLTAIRQLVMVVSTHVDDMKGGARREVADSLLKHLEREVGQCKIDWNVYSHTGGEHEHTPGVHWSHQRPYIAMLRPIATELLRGRQDEEEANEELHAAYMSLLGGVAWTILSRTEVSVYVQALQRYAHKPTVGKCRRLNLVLRFLVRQESGILYKRLEHPLKLVGMSDAAFRAQPDEPSGLALRGLAVMLMEADKEGPSSRNGRVHLLEYLTRRIRRVVRSTFSAALNALLDSVENVLLLQLALHELFCGVTEDVDDLVRRLENGH